MEGKTGDRGKKQKGCMEGWKETLKGVEKVRRMDSQPMGVGENGKNRGNGRFA